MSPELVQFIKLLAEPTFLVTGEGRIVFANDASADLTGTSTSALIGAALSSLVVDPAGRLHNYLGLCARSRQLVPGGFTWHAKGRQPTEVRCDGAVMQPKTESTPSMIVLRCRAKAESTDQFVLLNQKIAALSKEILDRKKAENQRDELLLSERAARIDAERAGRMKDEFLATLSHELRTPLHAILGWSQMLARMPALPAEASEGLEVIERNARAQTRLIEDLLDMSRIISGKVRLDVQRVELAPVIEASVATVLPTAEAKNVRLQVTVDPVAGPIKGDPGRLQQVVWNLLTNALKFTPKGGRVQISLERVNSHLEIAVSDTGEGIKPEFLPHVFDRFIQADATTTRRHGGLGLGLSIVKHLVELHGGTVRAKSPGAGQGSTFIVSLPLMALHDLDGGAPEKMHPRRQQSGEDPCIAPSLEGVRVLVVDDEPDARHLVQHLLKQCAAEVTTASSAREALQLLEQRHFDVLVSDIGMPEQDGFELIHRVRALPSDRGGAIPAIALTAFARSEDRTKAVLAGYQVHLSKPVEPPELVAMVASLAGRTGARS